MTADEAQTRITAFARRQLRQRARGGTLARCVASYTRAFYIAHGPIDQLPEERAVGQALATVMVSAQEALVFDGT